MQSIFSSYYPLTTEQLKQIWSECLFVFDTNVLLGLYQYPKNIRDELLGVFQTISDRIWIPFQVALEYQERRLFVISEQVRRYDEVEKAVNDFRKKFVSEIDKFQLKKYHSYINPDNLLDGINSVVDTFLEDVKNLKKNQPNVQDNDDLRDQIDTLFGTSIGPPPKDQKELDEIYSEGKDKTLSRLVRNRIGPGTILKAKVM